MISVKKRVICSILVATIILFVIPMVEATAQSFTVHAAQSETKLLNLVVDDRVVIKFTVTGRTTNMLDFYIVDPYGNVMASFGNTGSLDYTFVCLQEGEYKLNFSNTDSTEDKLVVLDYEVEHYIFGMPQMLFLTFIVVGICVAAVAVFVLLSRCP